MLVRAYNVKIGVIFGVRFERLKVDKKQTYMKNKTCKLYSGDFWIFLPKIIKIGHYSSEQNRFKVGAFFETQCRYSMIIRPTITNAQESLWRSQGTLTTSQTEEGICWFAWTFENDWLIEQCFTSPPTQYRLYGRLFLQVKRPNQQYQSTEGEETQQVP